MENELGVVVERGAQDRFEFIRFVGVMVVAFDVVGLLEVDLGLDGEILVTLQRRKALTKNRLIIFRRVWCWVTHLPRCDRALLIPQALFAPCPCY